PASYRVVRKKTYLLNKAADKLTIYKRKKQWKTTQNSDRFVILLFKTNNIFILKIYLSNSYK
ncbi:MAG TPA: hypothetical protein DCP04_10355, partial [Klebsiella pneumoniae]|nr:hypothetical protein [Klebsiella pneumoniae]